MAPQSEFKHCPHCRKSSIALTITVFKCRSCSQLVCDQCVKGFDDYSCPNCTRSIDRARDKVGTA